MKILSMVLAIVIATLPFPSVAGSSTAMMLVTAYVPPTTKLMERDGSLTVTSTDGAQTAFVRITTDGQTRLTPAIALQADTSIDYGFVSVRAGTFESPPVVLTAPTQTVNLHELLPKSVRSGIVYINTVY